ncbi:hypothetical protein M433DRAFT_159197 [Acidomyces richmondensis BFW]|nr:MAG: hypothetical protein FE78DRAFT_87198 [Acidomyces sp. 'richmondensis']KYG41298.1 hypothetical protein M433DRAFT_159197 [Acidomyces richmondensis BFW]
MAAMAVTVPKLDPAERHFFIPSPHLGLKLFVTHLPPTDRAGNSLKAVLYVHGATFPSALSIACRFHGRSWRDELAAAGYHVWTLDFHGFGHFSDPYPEFKEKADSLVPLGRTCDASKQLEASVRFILAHHGIERVSLIAHSWGTMVAGHLASHYPALIDRLVLFGPIAVREPMSTNTTRFPGWRLVSLKEQWVRFTETVPANESPVLLSWEFDEWGERYLDIDPLSRMRTPAAVKVPCGPIQDISDAWAGKFPYDPKLVKAPVAIIRGEWDNMSTDADARWFFDQFTSAPVRRDIKISRATHLMHLETSRKVLYRETEAFLAGEDITTL